MKTEFSIADGIRFKLIISFALIVTVSIVVLTTHISRKQYPLSNNTIWLNEVKLITENWDNLHSPLPNTKGQKTGVQIFHDKNWSVYRSFPNGHLEVYFEKSKENLVRINIDNNWQRETYPMLIMALPKKLYVVGYNVINNAPSGRSLKASETGFDLFEITPDTTDQPSLIAQGIDLGVGIDSLIYGRVYNQTVSICAENQCIDINQYGEAKHWTLDNLQKFEFIEVAFSPESAYAIVRKKWDDRFDGELNEEYSKYFLVDLNTEETPKPISDNGIPFSLSIHIPVVNENSVKLHYPQKL